MGLSKWNDENRIADIQLWSLQLGFTVSSIKTVYTGRASSVYRMIPPASAEQGSVIVKVSLNLKAIERESRISRDILPRLCVPVPKMLAAGRALHFAWIAWDDRQLEKLSPNVKTGTRAMNLLAAIHDTSLKKVDTHNLVSHTPNILQLTNELGLALRAGSIGTLLRELSPFDGVDGLGSLLEAAYKFSPNLVEMPEVLNHGDYHLGNVMWCEAQDEPYVIDWEFLHMDSPFFDLFQFLDATSPTMVLIRPLPRLSALSAYYEARLQWQHGRLPRRDFIRSYLYYAALHLIWILFRIEGDVRAQRFNIKDLARQRLETLSQLKSIRAELREVAPQNITNRQG